MNDTLLSVLICVLIAVIALAVVYGLNTLGKSNSEALKSVAQVTAVLPTLLEVGQVMSKQTDNATFDILKDIAKASSQTVEQIYKSNGTMTSAEKLDLAKDYFDKIASASKVGEVDAKVVEALIETAVFTLDKKGK